MYSFTEENYLKAIFKLQEQSDSAISTNSIALSLKTKAASVTDMIKKLNEKKLLNYEKYRGVELTEKGRKVAVDTVRKHRLWETFLNRKLNFTWDQVHDIAEQLEHIQSQELIEQLDAFLGFPTHDPHGDPIPGKNGELRGSDFVLMSQMQKGDTVIISGVVNHGTLFLKHLESIDLTLGKSLYIRDISEFDKTYYVLIEGKNQLQLSQDVVRNLLVKKTENHAK